MKDIVRLHKDGFEKSKICYFAANFYTIKLSWMPSPDAKSNKNEPIEQNPGVTNGTLTTVTVPPPER